MGWCRGSMIADELYNKISSYLPQEKKKEVAKCMVDFFSDQNADCWESDMDIVIDSGYKDEWWDDDEY